MKSYFEKLPKPWRDAIDGAIASVDANERPEIAIAYREIEARSLLDLVLGPKPDEPDIEDFGTAYVNFSEGWRAALKTFEKDQGAAIASWVREHGEATEHCTDDGEYPAFVILERDLPRV